MAKYQFVSMTRDCAHTIVEQWKYGGDYAVYDYRGEYVRLGVVAFNWRAIEAYERAGFVAYDRLVGKIAGQEVEGVCMRMRADSQTSEARHLYDPRGVRTYFDQYGTQEWDRLERTLQGRIKYAIHRRFLEQYVAAGARVLDVGCGPGRFALDLARRGASVTLADLSPTQLDLARQHLEAAGLLDRVEGFHCLDMVDMHELAGASYEVVVCFGSALSYTFDRYETALHELVRVLRPGGRLLLSVSCLYGMLRMVGPLDARAFLEGADAHIDWGAILAGADVVYTRPGSPEFHQPLVLFTSQGLRQALAKAGLRVVAMAASNPLVSTGAEIAQITASAEASAALTTLELALCDKPGLVDSGEHLLAVALMPSSE